MFSQSSLGLFIYVYRIKSLSVVGERVFDRLSKIALCAASEKNKSLVLMLSQFDG